MPAAEATTVRLEHSPDTSSSNGTASAVPITFSSFCIHTVPSCTGSWKGNGHIYSSTRQIYNS